jgi:hypothetical protein
MAQRRKKHNTKKHNTKKHNTKKHNTKKHNTKKYNTKKHNTKKYRGGVHFNPTAKQGNFPDSRLVIPTTTISSSPITAQASTSNPTIPPLIFHAADLPCIFTEAEKKKLESGKELTKWFLNIGGYIRYKYNSTNNDLTQELKSIVNEHKRTTNVYRDITFIQLDDGSYSCNGNFKHSLTSDGQIRDNIVELNEDWTGQYSPPIYRHENDQKDPFASYGMRSEDGM